VAVTDDELTDRRRRMVGPAALSTFREVFSGEIVLPGGPGYDRARAVWNATADRHPAMVARCTGVADVVAALRFAREQELEVAVRGGGHSYPGFSTCDGGIVVDLSPMRGVQVDPDRRVARAGGGALLAELDGAAQAFGLACPNGQVSHTGVAGLTLGGGLGHLMRKHGLTVDNLLSVDLVTADGRLVHASQQEHPELFWGLRGAGANFGVATSFEFRLHPVGPVVAGMMVFPAERAHEVAAAFTAWAGTAPDEVTASMGYGVAPAEPPFPPDLAGRPFVAVGATHAGSPADAERDLRPLRGLGPVADTFEPLPYLDLQRANDDYYAWGKRNYWKGLLLEGVPAEAVDALLDELAKAPGPSCGFGVKTLGGAVARVPEDAMAYSGRGAALWLLTEAVWLDPAGDGAHFAWARAAMRRLRGYATTVNYVNDLGEPVPGATRAAYGEAKYERLVALKRAWDPDNIFHRNQNIRP
jgi:FAD/FMN-containing dehydrogenase